MKKETKKLLNEIKKDNTNVCLNAVLVQLTDIETYRKIWMKKTGCTQEEAEAVSKIRFESNDYQRGIGMGKNYSAKDFVYALLEDDYDGRVPFGDSKSIAVSLSLDGNTFIVKIGDGLHRFTLFYSTAAIIRQMIIMSTKKGTKFHKECKEMGYENGINPIITTKGGESIRALDVLEDYLFNDIMPSVLTTEYDARKYYSKECDFSMRSILNGTELSKNDCEQNQEHVFYNQYYKPIYNTVKTIVDKQKGKGEEGLARIIKGFFNYTTEIASMEPEDLLYFQSESNITPSEPLPEYYRTLNAIDGHEISDHKKDVDAYRDSITSTLTIPNNYTASTTMQKRFATVINCYAALKSNESNERNAKVVKGRSSETMREYLILQSKEDRREIRQEIREVAKKYARYIAFLCGNGTDYEKLGEKWFKDGSSYDKNRLTIGAKRIKPSDNFYLFFCHAAELYENHKISFNIFIKLIDFCGDYITKLESTDKDSKNGDLDTVFGMCRVVDECTKGEGRPTFEKMRTALNSYLKSEEVMKRKRSSLPSKEETYENFVKSDALENTRALKSLSFALDVALSTKHDLVNVVNLVKSGKETCEHIRAKDSKHHTEQTYTLVNVCNIPDAHNKSVNDASPEKKLKKYEEGNFSASARLHAKILECNFGYFLEEKEERKRMCNYDMLEKRVREAEDGLKKLGVKEADPWNDPAVFDICNKFAAGVLTDYIFKYND